MSHRPRTIGLAVAAALVAALTGCTAQPAAAPPAAGATAQPAVETRFACPTGGEVAALTAVPFTESSAGDATCAYRTAEDADISASITVTRGSTSKASTLSALRAAAVRRGERTADARPLSFDAFTATSGSSCTAWFPAPDGVLTSVTARRSGAERSAVCDLATAGATLVGTGTPKGSAPTVAVVASSRLAGSSTSTAAWPWRIATRVDARIDRLTASGYLRPSTATSFAGVAAKVPADSAAVVLVSGTAEAGESRLAVLTGATAALSAAAGRAPDARLVVVGPVDDGRTAPEERQALADGLRAAAKIAGARYLDPADLVASDGGGLDAVSDGIAAELRDVGID